MKEWSHLDEQGKVQMVDVGNKEATQRAAAARAQVVMPSSILSQLKSSDFSTAKGSVIQTAVIAGIMGAKKTPELIPLCHTLLLNSVHVDIEVSELGLDITCTVKTTGKTGVEMEALTGASVAALTVYDMCKALSHDIEIRSLVLLSKSGGKNDYERK
jgi:cyclic pyranopterin phosphate synthase